VDKARGQLEGIGAQHFGRRRHLGRIYVTGSSEGPTAFDTQATLPSSDSAFVAKYDASGSLVWIQSGSSPPGDSGGAGISISATPTSGGVAVGGSYTGTLTFAGATLTSTGIRSAFVSMLCN